MRYIFLIIFTLSTFFSFSQDEKRLALVIGNANYDKGELKNPVNDARLIASTLDSLEFDVILKENLATKRDMTAAIREFGSKRSEYDVAFVYYAGHGIQVDDENFLLPTKEIFDEEFDVLDYGVSVQNIMRYLRAQTNEVNILILDACRNNPYESNFERTRSLGKGRGLAKIPPPTGSLIAFSTDSGQTAPDGEGDNSVYTISLAKNMLLEDTSIDQVFRNVRAEVLMETENEQRPVEATQLTGKTFILRPGTFEKEYAIVREIIDGEGDEANNYLKGLEYVTLMLNKNPIDKEAVKLAGELYEKLENYDEALEYINLSIELDPNYGISNRYVAKGYFLNEYFDNEEEALINYNKGIELDTARANSYYWRGLFYDEKENFDLAIADYNKAIELDPTESRSYFRIAYIYDAQLEQNDQALNTYFGYLEKFGSLDGGIYNNIALIYYDLKDFNKAIEYYDLGIKKNNARSLRNKALMLYQDLNDPEGALDLYNQAVEIDPENQYNYYARAEYFSDQDKWQLALEDYKKSFELNQELSNVVFRIAYVYGVLDEYDLQLSTYMKFLENFGEDRVVYNNMALIYAYDLEDYDKAIEYYDLSINLARKSNQEYTLAIRNKAELLYREFNKSEEAMELLNLAIEVEPENPSNYKDRSDCYEYYDEWELALADLIKALELDPDDGGIYFDLAIAYGNLNQLDLELSTYLEYLERFGEDITVYNNIAVIYEEKEDYDKAIEYYDLCIKENDDRSIRNKAELLYNKLGKTEEALELFNQAVELEPENPANYAFRADYYFDLDKWELALEDYKKTTELNPESARALFRTAYAYGELNEYDLQLSTYINCLKTFGEDRVVYNNMALIYAYDLDEFDKAIEYFDLSINYSRTTGKEYPIAIRNKAELLYTEFNKPEEALELFSLAIELDPENPSNYEFRAEYFSDQDKWQLALEDYKKSSELNPEYSYYKSLIALSYFELEDYENSLNTYLEYLEKFGESSWIYNRIGNVFEEGYKNYEKAIEYYDFSVSYEDNSYAHERKGIIYQNSNRYDEALSEFSRVQEFSPEISSSYFYLINLYISYDKFEEAIEVSKKLIDLSPEDPDIYYKLSLIHEKQDDYVKAIHASNISIARFGLGNYYVGSIDNSDNKLVKEDMYQHRISLYKTKGMNDFVCEDLNTLKELIIAKSIDEEDKNSKLKELEKFAGMSVAELNNCSVN